MRDRFINGFLFGAFMIPVSEPDLSGNELKYVQDCVQSGWISSIGKYIGQFEKMFSSFCGVPYGVAVCNGTVALHLSMVALGIKPSDEVIVPNLTFVATANAVKHCGATPVFADIEPETWNINADSLEAKITSKTKAILPVHLYGHACDMDKILAVAKKYNLLVIEDCAEAHGGMYKGARVGSFGDVGCFSFYANKIITSGEGGMITTKNKELYDKMCFLRDHAMSKERRYWHPEVGFNYRLTNLQAAVGTAQCERIDQIINKKIANAQIYNARLGDCLELVLPPEKDWAKNVYWMYSVLISENAKISRDEVMVRLKGKGIDTRPFFYPISDLPPYSEGLNTGKDFPVSARISAQGINLPSSAVLTPEQIFFVADTLKELLR